MKKRFLLPFAGSMLIGAGLIAQTVGQMSEEEVKSKYARTQADLRSMHVAMATYHVDYNQYPSQLQGLTTPIAYFSSLIPDQFEQPLKDGDPVPDHLTKNGSYFGEPGLIKMGVMHDSESPLGGKFIIYGVGPDGIDDRGEVEYDPTNGLFSSGDVIRIVDETSLPHSAFDSSIAMEINNTSRVLKRAEEAVIRYAMAEEKFPPNFNALTTPIAYLDFPDTDPFLQGLPLGYTTRGDGDNSEAIIYSVGPDLDDDGGVVQAKLFEVTDASTVDGDIIAKIEWSDVMQRIRPHDAEDAGTSSEDPYRDMLLDWQVQNGGKQNALLYYHDAMKLAPSRPDQTQEKIIEQIIYEANFDGVVQLGGWINHWDESFELLQAGADLDFAEGPGPVKGLLTPIPNYTEYSDAVKALLVSGMIDITNDLTDEGLKKIITALKIGRDLQSPGNAQITYHIGSSSINKSINAVSFVLNTNKLSSEQLGGLFKALESVEKNRQSFVSAFEFDRDAIFITLEEEWSKPESKENFREILKEEGLNPDQPMPTFDEFKPYFEAQLNKVIVQIDGPFEAGIVIDHWIPDDTPIVIKAILKRIQTNSFNHGFYRDSYLCTANLRVMLLVTAVELYNLQTGEYPKDTADLLPFFNGRLLQDPFGHGIINFSLDEEKGYRVWSIGPDQKNEQGLKYIDRTKYEFEGDLIYPPSFDQ